MILHRKSPGLFHAVVRLAHPLALSVLLGLSLLIVGIAYQYSSGIQSRVTNLIGSLTSQAKSHLFSNTSLLDRLDIDIGVKGFEQIDGIRKRLIDKEIHIGDLEDTDWVRAKIRIRDQSHRVRLRLKGLDEEHWGAEQGWSFRVKVLGMTNILGARHFQLQKVKSIESVMEWVMMQAFAAEGLIAHQVHFVSAYLNGEPWGPYILQNHYDKVLIEGSGFPEGPIIGFSKDSQFDAERLSTQHQRVWEPDAFWRAPIAITQLNKIKANPSLMSLASRGVELLEKFRSGALPVSAVFDVEPLAKQIALRAVLGAGEFDWRDSKFYVNPITQKLELISREIHYKAASTHSWWLISGDKSKLDQQDFHSLFYRDDFFLERFVHYLEAFSKESYLQTLISNLNSEIAALEAAFGIGTPFSVPTAELEGHAAYIRATLQPPVAINAYVEKSSSDHVLLRVGAIQHFPVTIGCIVSEDIIVACPTESSILHGKTLGVPAAYSQIKFHWIARAGVGPLEIPDSATLKHGLLGSSGTLEVSINPFSVVSKTSEVNASQELNLRQWDPGTHNKADKVITVGPGLWRLDREFFVPRGYTFNVLPGTTVQLSNGASIISEGRLLWLGTQDKKIVVENPTGTGRGILVLSAPAKSALAHVIFRGLANPLRNEYASRGAISFYQSDLSITDTIFEGNIESDDFLNVVRARVDIKNSVFRDTNADAVDIDFGRANFDSVRFERIGNDAIDISGTYALARNLDIQRVGDKGISVGEKSTIDLSESRIEGAAVGIAIKDLSHLSAHNVWIGTTPIGVALYQKKPEFGPATAKFTATDEDGDHVPPEQLISGNLISEEQSFLSINGQQIGEVSRSTVVEKMGLESD